MTDSTIIGATAYETIAAGQTDQILGGRGAVADYLERVIIFVTISASGTVTIKDNATTWGVFPNSIAGGAGVYVIPVGCHSANGAWKITTGAGSTAVAVGKFTL